MIKWKIFFLLFFSVFAAFSGMKERVKKTINLQQAIYGHTKVLIASNLSMYRFLIPGAVQTDKLVKIILKPLSRRRD